MRVLCAAGGLSPRADGGGGAGGAQRERIAEAALQGSDYGLRTLTPMDAWTEQLATRDVKECVAAAQFFAFLVSAHSPTS